MPLVRPSMSRSPSTSAIAPAVSATARVPRRPANRYDQVLICVKNIQYLGSSWPVAQNWCTTNASNIATATALTAVPMRILTRVLGPGVS